MYIFIRNLFTRKKEENKLKFKRNIKNNTLD